MRYKQYLIFTKKIAFAISSILEGAPKSLNRMIMLAMLVTVPKIVDAVDKSYKQYDLNIQSEVKRQFK